jgi:hypothetical protein
MPFSCEIRLAFLAQPFDHLPVAAKQEKRDLLENHCRIVPRKFGSSPACLSTLIQSANQRTTFALLDKLFHRGRPSEAMNCRDYKIEDKEICLEIFQSNVPDYFAPNELSDVTYMLEEIPYDMKLDWHEAKLRKVSLRLASEKMLEEAKRNSQCLR